MLLSHAASVIETRQPVVVEGDTYYKSDWLDSGRDPQFAPTTFLVEQPPHVSLRTHFHRNDQFQLFLRGRGAIGRHPLSSVMVHFATGYSAYGPIVAGDDGLTWLTLRTAWETGSLTMKDHADQMRRVRKRQFHAKSPPLLGRDALAKLEAITEHELIPLQADGLAVRLLTLPPGAIVHRQDASPSSGQFRVVLAGGLVVAESTPALAPWEHCYLEAAEDNVPLVAGTEGAQVVILRFPVRAGDAG